MSNILFSIVVPTYNRGHYLPNTVAMLLRQDYLNWELLIVDDGSNDDTGTIAAGFSDNRIHYYKKENGGVSSARNYGASLAKGDYLVFLDSDDTVTENWLSHFFESINGHSAQPDLVCGGMEKRNTVTQETRLVKPSDRGNGAIGWAVIIPGAFAVHKLFFTENGQYDEDLKYAENTELFMRFGTKKPKLAYTENFDLIYNVSSDGGSKNLINMINSNKLILEKHDSILSTTTKFLFNQKIGVTYLRFGDNKNASKYFMEAIKYKPLQIRTYIRFIISKSTFLTSVFYCKKIV